MKYIEWLEAKETAKEIGKNAVGIVIKAVLFIVRLARVFLFAICSLALAIFGISFLPGCYFAYRVVIEMLQGTPFLQTEYYGFFLLFFCVPLVLVGIREIAKP